MEQQNPDESIVQVPLSTWNSILDYVEAVEWLLMAVEDLINRDALQPELRIVFYRVSAVVNYLDRLGAGRERPSENQASEEVTQQGGQALLEVRETADAAPTATDAAEGLRWWRIYPATGGCYSYYGSYNGAVQKCDKLTPANVSCYITTGRC